MSETESPIQGPLLRNIASVSEFNNYFWHWWNSDSLPDVKILSNTRFQHTYYDFATSLRLFGRHILMKHLKCKRCNVRLNNGYHAREHFHHKLVNDGDLHIDDGKHWSAIIFMQHFRAAEANRMFESRLLQIMNEYVIQLGILIYNGVIIEEDQAQRGTLEIIQMDKEISELVATFAIKDNLGSHEQSLSRDEQDTIIALRTMDYDLSQLVPPIPVLESISCFDPRR